MAAPQRTDGRRDLDGDGDIDLADDPVRDLDHNGRIEGEDREEMDVDADLDIDATDRALAEKKSVGAALGMAKAGQAAQQGKAQGMQQAPKVR
ncbi:hypothetical protein [Prosthecobacter vanneervenii]|uniref:Uncharacterized protein n=1 Tax=Prosthecobacter vanneervenii TaxID=48466 RepID=A0A7W8DJP7_9BACT|nr:hypothetical protein [Prosthecobacter vanneervenii]MBB5032374.1 hypothetical protein [Prosthecobacter vanneervenii]